MPPCTEMYRKQLRKFGENLLTTTRPSTVKSRRSICLKRAIQRKQTTLKEPSFASRIVTLKIWGDSSVF